MRTRILATFIAAPIAVFIIACGAPATKIPEDGTSPSTGNEIPAVVATTEPAVLYSVPSPTDFSLSVTELERKCFGSAGCNVTFTVVLTQTNPVKFDPSKSYKLLYTINGTEDMYTNYMTITGDQYRHDDEEFAQVKNQKTKLTATITSIIVS